MRVLLALSVILSICCIQAVPTAPKQPQEIVGGFTQHKDPHSDPAVLKAAEVYQTCLNGVLRKLWCFFRLRSKNSMIISNVRTGMAGSCRKSTNPWLRLLALCSAGLGFWAQTLSFRLSLVLTSSSISKSFGKVAQEWKIDVFQSLPTPKVSYEVKLNMAQLSSMKSPCAASSN